MSAIGPKRTSLVALHMSAFGGKADMPHLSAPQPERIGRQTRRPPTQKYSTERYATDALPLMLRIIRQGHGNSGKADSEGNGYRPKLKPHSVTSHWALKRTPAVLVPCDRQ